MTHLLKAEPMQPTKTDYPNNMHPYTIQYGDFSCPSHPVKLVVSSHQISKLLPAPRVEHFSSLNTVELPVSGHSCDRSVCLVEVSAQLWEVKMQCCWDQELLSRQVCVRLREMSVAEVRYLNLKERSLSNKFNPSYHRFKQNKCKTENPIYPWTYGGHDYSIFMVLQLVYFSYFRWAYGILLWEMVTFGKHT